MHSLPDDSYFAGFFDGEGCVSIEKTRLGHYSVRVAVGNTNRDVLQLMADKYGGKIYLVKHREENPRHKPSYLWNITSKKAEAFLISIQPYVFIKRERVDLALSFRRMINLRLQSAKPTEQVTQEENIQREEMYQEMKKMNYRGIRQEVEGVV